MTVPRPFDDALREARETLAWQATDAAKHTGLANTARRAKLWAHIANKLREAGFGPLEAIERANTALYQHIEADIRRRAQRATVRHSEARNGRLL